MCRLCTQKRGIFAFCSDCAQFEINFPPIHPSFEELRFPPNAEYPVFVVRSRSVAWFGIRIAYGSTSPSEAIQVKQSAIRKGMSANPATVHGNVLVVSNWPRGVVVQAAERCGLTADVVGDVPEAVLNLGRRRYRAVLADLDRSNVDCLELVLNVRDFDPAVPIAVLASEWVMADLMGIGTQSGTMLVAKSDRVSDMSNELARLPLLKKSMVTAAS